MFIALSLSAVFFAFSFKSLKLPFWKTDLLANKFLLVSLSINVLLLLLTLTTPALRSLLSLTTLHGFEIMLLIAVGIFNLLTIELAKRIVFGRS
jgi:magnesium-transporting ATPase (P-type)